MSNGLGMYANTPPLSASAAARVSALAVIMMTGTFTPRPRICFRSSRPPIRGMCMSSRMRSNFPRSRTISASAPSFADSVSYEFVVAELPEEILQDFDHRGLVVDDQDSLGHSRSI